MDFGRVHFVLQHQKREPRDDKDVHLVIVLSEALVEGARRVFRQHLVSHDQLSSQAIGYG